MYKRPSSKKEYWEIIDRNWNDIMFIFNLHFRMLDNKWIDETTLDKPLGEYIEELRFTRNPRLVRAFSAAWWKCSDDDDIKTENILANLCEVECRVLLNNEDSL